MPEDRIEAALAGIGAELEQRLTELRSQGKLLEAQRLSARTRYDMEMIREVGFCSGIENYARHLAGLAPHAKPYTLLDYFPDDFLLIIDESHVTLPQLRAMYAGDQSRKTVLVEHGFRLPSALDNRPLRFDEFEQAGLEKASCEMVAPPRVAASPVAFECRLITRVELPSARPEHSNNAVFGEVVGVHIDPAIIVDGLVDVTKYRPLARLGYMQYTSVDNVFDMPRPTKA